MSRGPSSFEQMALMLHFALLEAFPAA